VLDAHALDQRQALMPPLDTALMPPLDTRRSHHRWAPGARAAFRSPTR